LLLLAQILDQAFGGEGREEHQNPAKLLVLLRTLRELFEPIRVEKLVRPFLNGLERCGIDGLLLDELSGQIEDHRGSRKNTIVELPDPGVDQIAEARRGFTGIRRERDDLAHRMESGARCQRSQ
jgi:hypothetical protein